ncbi:hypothetical protein X975_07388, partial [Stegodyphus mimosarum]
MLKDWLIGRIEIKKVWFAIVMTWSSCAESPWHRKTPLVGLY